MRWPPAATTAERDGVDLAWQTGCIGYKPITRVDAALYELSEYGFILSWDDLETLIADPPQELGAFVDAVLVGDGLPPAELCEQRLVSMVTEILREWVFDDGQGKGTRSGLPLLLDDNP